MDKKTDDFSLIRKNEEIRNSQPPTPVQKSYARVSITHAKRKMPAVDPALIFLSSPTNNTR